jgi:hypothetical protein
VEFEEMFLDYQFGPNSPANTPLPELEIEGTPVEVFFSPVDGTDRLGGEVDLDALVTYFGANSPVPPGPQDRITVIP